MKKITAIKSLILILLTGWMIVGCVDNNETPPPFKEFEYGTIVPISQVKALYDAELAKNYTERMPVEITEDWAIKGIIIANDKKNGNLYKEGFIEDEGAGLLMKFEATGGVYIGDSVIVNVKGLFLGDYGDFVQMGGVPYTDLSGNYRVSGFNKDVRIIRQSINNPTTPSIHTVTSVKNSANLGRLVKIEDVQFADNELGKSYADASTDPPASANRYITDCSGKKIIVRSSGYSTFAGLILPEGKGSITGVLTKFSSDYQLVIRDISEVLMDGDRCPPGGQVLGQPVETLSQDFSSFANNEDIITPGWQNYTQAGTRIWRAQIFSGNTYAQATGYLSNESEIVSILIPPPIILSTQKILTFKSAKAYWTHTTGAKPLQVYFSTDYNGTNYTTATWTLLPARVAIQTDSDHAWINSGDITLPVSAGQSGTIAFVYRGSHTESTSLRLDDIVVRAAK